MSKRKSTARERTNRRTNDEERKIAVALSDRRLERWRALKVRFDRAHRAGLDALSRGKYDGLQNAIIREREIINQLRALIDEAKVLIASRRPLSRRGRT